MLSQLMAQKHNRSEFAMFKLTVGIIPLFEPAMV